MDDRFSNRQDQALTRGFAVLMRLAWILATALMVATLGEVGLALGVVVGVLYGSLRFKYLPRQTKLQTTMGEQK